MPSKKLVRTAFNSLILILLMAMTSSGWVATSFANQELAASPSEAVTAIERWITLSQQLRDHVDHSQFDLEKFVFRNEFDDTRLVEAIKQSIQFHQYPGVQRGADGTLAVRAGNAIDQAILLAGLLKDAGYQARIVRNELTDDHVNVMFRELIGIAPEVVPFRDAAADTVLAMMQFGEKYRGSTSVKRDTPDLNLGELQTRQQEFNQAFVAVLAETGMRLSEEPVPAYLYEEARDYFWVQYRLGPGDEWINVHPIFPSDPESFSDLAPNEFFKDSLPADLQQRIAIQFKARRRVGNSTEVVDLTSSWERPIANLFEKVIDFKIVSRSSQKDTGDSVEELDYSEIFVPLLGEAPAPGAKAFTLRGTIVDADVAMSNMAGVFAEVGDKGSEATSALMNLGSSPSEPEQPAMALEDVWLEIQLTHPGKHQPLHITRSFRSGSTDHPLSRRDLLKRMAIEIFFGKQGHAKRMDRLLEYQVEALKLSLHQHRSMVADQPYTDLGQSSQEQPIDWSVLNSNIVFASLSEFDAEIMEGAVSYRHHPMIVIGHESLIADTESPVGIDIANNSRRSFKLSPNGDMQFSPQITLQAGLWEALSESRVIELQSSDTRSAVSETESLLAGSGLAVIRTPAELQTTSGVSLFMKEGIQKSLAMGRVALVPQPADSRALAWWALDPATGEVLGITDNGWGGSYFILSSQATSDIVLRKTSAFLTCLVIANAGCRSMAKMAIAALQLAITGGSFAGCEAIMSQLPLPPGTPSPCPYITTSSQMVSNMVGLLEQPIYKQCFKAYLPECLKGAGLTP